MNLAPISLRLLEFFNANSVETEVVISSSEDLLDLTAKSRLRDLTKLTFFADLDDRGSEECRHQLATEKIGAIFVGNVTAAKFASKFAYTSCPYVLMINQGAADIDYLQQIGLDVRKEKIILMTHSRKIRQWLSQTGFESELVDFFPAKETPPPVLSAESESDPSSLDIGFIAFAHSHPNYEQIASIAGDLREKEHCRITLFFNKPEYEYFMTLVRKDRPAYEPFFNDGQYKIVVYEDLEEAIAQHKSDIFLSYDKPGFLPREYSSLVTAQKLLFMCRPSAVNEDIFGGTKGFFFMDYFDVPGIVGKIALLKKDPDMHRSMIAKQSLTLREYCDPFREVDLPGFFFKKATDFSEVQDLSPKVTVIFHFHFYSFDNTTFLYYKKRLREFYKPNVNFLFSITEDSYEIPAHARSLQRAFPSSIVKIVPNKGRDIGAKFILLDYFLRQGGDAEYVVILHDKKSLHLPYGEAKAWIDSLLRIIDSRYYQAIIGHFAKEQKTGIIGSAERIVDCILRFEGSGLSKRPVFEWNNDLLHYMIDQYNIRINDYNFVGGTMFWVKGSLLKELHKKYHFLNEYRKLEEGNVMDNNGSTITHCWERLFCWLSTNSGYKIEGI